ncbi:MAG: hypothetical protein KKA81_00715 [Bacteroidetes bacterium]|nr:hypothetical protein [Bacteroidota bacterium]
MFYKNALLQILILLSILVASGNLSAQGGNEEYSKAITLADEYFRKGDYVNAKAAYQHASKLNPDDEYPKKQLQESLSLLRVQIENRGKYNQRIKTADELFQAKSYDKAITVYEEAAKILPNEPYPGSKISEIKQLMEEEKTNRIKYDETIKRADGLFQDAKLDEARKVYEEALQYIDYESHPKDQIIEIDKQIAKLNALQTSYNKAIASAEEYLKRKNYQEAINSYQEAARLKPEEELPKQKLTELSNFLETYGRYNELISAADELYIGQQYESARIKYSQALEILPGERYPQDMISKVNEALKEKTVENWQRYDELIAEADRYYDQKEYEKAMETYNNALRFKPDETYARTRIQAINDMLDLRRTQEAAYDNTLLLADKLFNEGNLNGALAEYRKAHDMKPMEQYPKVRADEVEMLLADLKNKEDQYNQTVAGADKLFNAGDYVEALGQYTRALELFPAKQYPKDQITMINDILGKEKAAEEAYNLAISTGDKHFESGDFDNAKIQYITALDIKPDAQYPRDKVSEINSILASRKAQAEAFNLALQQADRYYDEKNYEQALLKYNEADSLIAGDSHVGSRIREINTFLEETARKEAEYINLIAQGDTLYEGGAWQAAIAAYSKAGSLKPTETYPSERIKTARAMLAEAASLQALEEEYTGKLAIAEDYFIKNEYELAKQNYREAADLKPGESFPLTKISEIEALQENIARYNDLNQEGDVAFTNGDFQLAIEKYTAAGLIFPEKDYHKFKITEANSALEAFQRKRALDEQYNKHINDADSLFLAKDYSQAIDVYTQASGLKPEENYPVSRIAEIRQILEQMAEEKEKAYTLAITRGDNFFNESNYKEAINAYRSALEIKPGEVYPRDRMKEAETLYLSALEALTKTYRQLVGEGDAFFNDKIYDKAIEKYLEARKILPDEPYPDEMVRKITRIINDNAIVDINQEKIVIPENTEKKFSFSPMPIGVRKENYILVKARNPVDREFKMLVNFGQDATKNGGIALRIPESADETDFIIRLGSLYKWFSEDNNWVSIYPEGGDIEIGLIRISKSE